MPQWVCYSNLQCCHRGFLWWSAKHSEHERSPHCRCQMQMQMKTIYGYDHHHHHLSNRIVVYLQLRCSQFSKCNGLNNCPVFGLFAADFTIVLAGQIVWQIQRHVLWVYARLYWYGNVLLSFAQDKVLRGTATETFRATLRRMTSSKATIMWLQNYASEQFHFVHNVSGVSRSSFVLNNYSL